MTTANRNSALDPCQFIIIKPLLTPNPCGDHLRTQNGSTRYTARQPTREHVFWDNYRRRQRQLTRQGYRSAPWRPYEEVGHPMEPKRLILEALGQHVEELTTDDLPQMEDKPLHTDPSDSAGVSKSLQFRSAPAGRREDSASLRRHLGHARRLVSAVKQGRGYFQLLQQEEEEEEERQSRRREEQRRAEPRSPCLSSDSDGWPLTGGADWSCGNGVRPCRKKDQSARPFTPVHRSLTSPLLSEAPPEVIYRQLCCLNWLLEALTLERSGRAGPVTSCWDPKLELSEDRGGVAIAGHTSDSAKRDLRTLLDAVHESVRRELYGPGHSPSTSSLTDRLEAPHSHLLRYRLDKPTGPKTTETPRPKSCPVKPQSATSQLISSKTSMLEGLKAAYEERAVELAQSYADILEHNARKRLDSGLMKFRALRHMTHSRRLPRHVIWPSVTTVKAPETDVTERLSTLLSSLPSEVCRERAVRRVLEKLSGFADERTPRVQPHLFLKVLGGLQPWELCLPDLCVAIEIARDHVVQMPREEYDAWLCSRVTLPLQDCHAPTQSREMEGGWT